MSAHAPCPFCGVPVPCGDGLATRCPYCGRGGRPRGGAAQRRTAPWIVGIALVLGSVAAAWAVWPPAHESTRPRRAGRRPPPPPGRLEGTATVDVMVAPVTNPAPAALPAAPVPTGPPLAGAQAPLVGPSGVFVPPPEQPDFRTEPFPKALSEVALPEPQHARHACVGPRVNYSAAAVTPVRLDDAVPSLPLPPAHIGLFAGVCWAADGLSFYVASTKGLVRRITYPGLEEVGRVDCQQPCRQLVSSGAGLLLTLPILQELWVIDPEALTVRRRFGIAGLRRVMTGPDLTFALVLANPERGPGWPLRLNLADGALTGVHVRSGSLAPQGTVDFRAATLAPDGGRLFTEFGSGHLACYRVDGDALTLEAATEAIAQGGRGEICVSPDGRSVCLPTTEGHAGVPDGLTVFAVGAFARPAVTLRPGAGSYTVGFDPAGRRYYMSTTDHPLHTFDATGAATNLVPRDAFPEGPHDVHCYLPHRDRRGLLVLTSEALYLIEFDGTGPTP